MVLDAVGVLFAARADNRLDLAVVVENGDGALRLHRAGEFAPVIRIVARLVLKDSLRLALHIHIDIGVDIEAAVVHLEAGFALGQAVALLQILDHVGEDLLGVPAPVPGDGILVLGGDVEPGEIIVLPRFLILLLGDEPVFIHLLENVALALLILVGVVEGVVFGGVLRNADDGGGFREVELLGVLAEVCLGGCLKSVAAAAERDDVEIRLQHLRLGVFLFQLERLEDFLELTVDAVGVLLSDVLDELLRDGGAAAVVLRETEEHIGKGEGSALPVDAVMAPEALVLHGDRRVLGVLGHLVVIHPFAVFGAVHGFVLDHILIAVIREDGGGIVELELGQVDVADALVQKSQHIDHRRRADNAGGDHHDEKNGGKGLGEIAAGAQKHLEPRRSVGDIAALLAPGRSPASGARSDVVPAGVCAAPDAGAAGRSAARPSGTFAQSVFNFAGNSFQRILKSHLKKSPPDILRNRNPFIPNIIP